MKMPRPFTIFKETNKNILGNKGNIIIKGLYTQTVAKSHSNLLGNTMLSEFPMGGISSAIVRYDKLNLDNQGCYPTGFRNKEKMDPQQLSFWCCLEKGINYRIKYLSLKVHGEACFWLGSGFWRMLLKT